MCRKDGASSRERCDGSWTRTASRLVEVRFQSRLSFLIRCLWHARVLKNLLRLTDPAYAKLLEKYVHLRFCPPMLITVCISMSSTSPLPYHALSHLLTLFSHDIPTLPLIQHVWDFLLSREPIAVVWLAAAVSITNSNFSFVRFLL